MVFDAPADHDLAPSYHSFDLVPAVDEYRKRCSQFSEENIPPPTFVTVVLLTAGMDENRCTSSILCQLVVDPRRPSAFCGPNDLHRSPRLITCGRADPPVVVILPITAAPVAEETTSDRVLVATIY